MEIRYIYNFPVFCKQKPKNAFIFEIKQIENRKNRNFAISVKIEGVHIFVKKQVNRNKKQFGIHEATNIIFV